METLQEIQDVVQHLNSPSHVDVQVETEMVTLKSDNFNEVPATNEAPPTVYVSATGGGRVEVRPVGSGGERRDVSPEEAANYINNMFL